MRRDLAAPVARLRNLRVCLSADVLRTAERNPEVATRLRNATSHEAFEVRELWVRHGLLGRDRLVGARSTVATFGSWVSAATLGAAGLDDGHGVGRAPKCPGELLGVVMQLAATQVLNGEEGRLVNVLGTEPADVAALMEGIPLEHARLMRAAVFHALPVALRRRVSGQTGGTPDLAAGGVRALARAEAVQLAIDDVAPSASTWQIVPNADGTFAARYKAVPDHALAPGARLAYVCVDGSPFGTEAEAREALSKCHGQRVTASLGRLYDAGGAVHVFVSRPDVPVGVHVRDGRYEGRVRQEGHTSRALDLGMARTRMEAAAMVGHCRMQSNASGSREWLAQRVAAGPRVPKADVSTFATMVNLACEASLAGVGATSAPTGSVAALAWAVVDLAHTHAAGGAPFSAHARQARLHVCAPLVRRLASHRPEAAAAARDEASRLVVGTALWVAWRDATSTAVTNPQNALLFSAAAYFHTAEGGGGDGRHRGAKLSAARAGVDCGLQKNHNSTFVRWKRDALFGVNGGGAGALDALLVEVREVPVEAPALAEEPVECGDGVPRRAAAAFALLRAVLGSVAADAGAGPGTMVVGTAWQATGQEAGTGAQDTSAAPVTAHMAAADGPGDRVRGGPLHGSCGGCPRG